jgi:hypothetical protein
MLGLRGQSWTGEPISAAPERQRRAGIEEFKAPLDLREWVDTWTLAGWIEEEVEQLAQIESGVAASGPGMMFRLLTFAYASRVFESDEIIRLSYSDAAFRVLCEGEPPTAQQLRSFRRTHRASLERILARVLLRAIQKRFELEAASLEPGLEEDLLDRATERLNIARHMDQP